MFRPAQMLIVMKSPHPHPPLFCILIILQKVFSPQQHQCKFNQIYNLNNSITVRYYGDFFLYSKIWTSFL